jgi:predicted DNA-binding protein (MmcQ/YjbR family)
MAAIAARLARQLERIRDLALALPEATEELTWGDVNFRVRRKIFCFPHDGRSITVKADPEELPALLGDPRVKPAPYLAKAGWVVLDLTTPTVDWDEVDELLRTSYCLVAPKALARQVDAPS